MREQRGRTAWLRVRVRETEREALQSAARRTGQWVSELARECINLRVRQILEVSESGSAR